MQLIILFVVLATSICDSVVIRTDPNRVNEELINRDHVRRKRYLGLSKKFKLNKRYQECVSPGNIKGHCKHLPFCPINILKGARSPLEYICVIENNFVGVCCPDDIILSGMIGSQLIMDLPAGGEDYSDKDNTTGCGIPAVGRSITPTKSARVQEWPWLAALYDVTSFPKGQQFCAGAVITDTHILSAAHCFSPLHTAMSNIRVRLGEYDFSKSNETRWKDYAIAEIVTHEDFDLGTYANDIAIVRLAEPTLFNSYIWPICLPSGGGGTFENETVVVAGWGTTESGGTSPVLLEVRIPIWNQELCVDSFLQRITEYNFCAASYEGGKDACKGDSGGPLMYQLENGRWVTIGVVSWGILCGNKGSPGVYTRVDKYIPWIITNTISKV